MKDLENSNIHEFLESFSSPNQSARIENGGVQGAITEEDSDREVTSPAQTEVIPLQQQQQRPTASHKQAM